MDLETSATITSPFVPEFSAIVFIGFSQAFIMMLAPMDPVVTAAFAFSNAKPPPGTTPS